MSDELRDRLIDHCARIQTGPFVVPTDGVIKINAESMADALIPFIRKELATAAEGCEHTSREAHSS